MSVPAGNSKTKKHEVNYLVKQTPHFQVAVITLLVMILLVVASIYTTTTNHNEEILREMFKIYDKIAQTEQE
jgi:hypothetical protein